jgi:hypothetical protein
MARSATFSGQPDGASPPLDGVERAVRGWLDDPGNRSDRVGKWACDLEMAGREPRRLVR